MNRQGGRANASVQRQGNVSVRLVQEQLQTLEQQYALMRNIVFSIVREQGRVRLSKAELEARRQGEELVTRDIGDHWLLELKQSNMVAPHGVTNGKANDAPKESA